MCHEQSKRRKLLCKLVNGFIVSVLMIIIFTVLTYLVFIAIDKEASFNENVKAERCATWGENVPKAMEGYCE